MPQVMSPSHFGRAPSADLIAKLQDYQPISNISLRWTSEMVSLQTSQSSNNTKNQFPPHHFGKLFSFLPLHVSDAKTLLPALHSLWVACLLIATDSRQKIVCQDKPYLLCEKAISLIGCTVWHQFICHHHQCPNPIQVAMGLKPVHISPF